jgi:uncharacterized membrane protein
MLMNKRGDTAVIDPPAAEDKPETAEKPQKAATPASAGSGANLVYILYLIAAVFPPAGLAGVAGVAMAYLNIPDASELAQEHYRFQIRTFWMWLGLAAIGTIGAYFMVGWLILAAASVWFIIRCVKGMTFLNKGKPYPHASTFLW